MRTFICILVAALLSVSSMAQQGFYLGYENGGLFDKYNYVNSKGHSLTQTSIGGMLGGYLGYQQGVYSIETGFYSLSSHHPMLEYDYQTFQASGSSSMASGPVSYLVPLRIGMEFLLLTNKLFIKPQFGFHMLISDDYAGNQSNMGWGTHIDYFLDDTAIPNSTKAHGYIPSKLNFGIDPSISAGVRIKKRADVYIKGSYMANFNQTYYELISHYSETETVLATRNTNSAFLLQLGLKFFIAKA